MNRPFLMCVLFAVAGAAVAAQESSQSSPYQGTANPPADEEITTTETATPKPPAGKPLNPQYTAPAPARTQSEPRPSSVDPSVNYPDLGSDEGIVRAARPASRSDSPALSTRGYADDPDGDIVHPRHLHPGEIAAGITIRVKLMHQLSTSYSERGEQFRSRVASDVVQGGEVLIPAGAEIDGKVVDVSTGHTGGFGTMRLLPEMLVLADGRHFRLDAELTGAPGSKARIGGEGTVRPGSRLKRDGIEYGGVVGGGAVTGAVLGGPIGALTGGLIGAGIVTVHLLVNHPQATLESGTTLLFTLNEPLNIVPADRGGD